MQIRFQITLASGAVHNLAADMGEVEATWEKFPIFLNEISSEERGLAGMALGLSFGAYILDNHDEGDPLTCTARAGAITCVTQVCAPDLEAFFGVSRQ